MGSITGKTWVDHSEPRIMAADLEAIEAAIDHKPKPPSGTDFNTLAPGTYTWSSSSGTYPNSPPVLSTGVVVVTDSRNNTYTLRQQIYYADTGLGVWYRSASTSGVWYEWVRLDASPGDVGSSIIRDMRISEFRLRRGGVVGTGGLKAIALRFDHALTAFKSKLLPLLKQYGFPWAQAITTNRVGFGEDVMTWAELQTACIESGGEIANHSLTHGNPTGPLATAREVIDSLNTLKTNLPRIPIEMWMPPGQPAGTWDGYMPAATLEQHDTYAGRLALANHALLTGYMPSGGSYNRPLTGHIIQGLPHYTADVATLAQLQSRVDTLPAGHGLQIMWHPGLIDTSGYATLATVDAFFAWLAAERDAGRLLVLTPSALSVADSNRPRHLYGAYIEPNRTGTVGATHMAHATGVGTLTVETTAATPVTIATATRTTHGQLWLPFTVPLDGTSFRITRTGTLTTPTVAVS